MIDFDSLAGIADDEYSDPNVPVALGLVVAAKARRGEDLNIEAQAFVDSTRGLPLILFIELADDDPTVECFGNAEEYQRAMDRLTPPTEEEAIAWENARISEQLQKWADRLEEVGQ
jgi:hypothetical protein